MVTFAYLIYLPVSRLAYLRCAIPTPVISYRYIYSVIDHIAVYDICKLSTRTSTATFTNINKRRTSLLSIVLRWWYTGRWRVGCYIWYSKKGTGLGGVAPHKGPSSDTNTKYTNKIYIAPGILKRIVAQTQQWWSTICEAIVMCKYARKSW